MKAFRLPVAMSLAFALFAMLLPGDAQQATRVPRVGLLRLGSPADPYVDAFRRGLRDRGYVAGHARSIF